MSSQCKQGEVNLNVPAASPGNAFRLNNGYDLISLERDKAVIRLEIQQKNLNTYGLPHGGILFAIADEAGGAAAHTDGRCYVTQNSSFHFIKTQSRGILDAIGTVRGRRDSAALVRTDIINEAGDLLATGEFCYHCVGENREEQEAKLRQKKL